MSDQIFQIVMTALIGIFSTASLSGFAFFWKRGNKPPEEINGVKTDLRLLDQTDKHLADKIEELRKEIQDSNNLRREDMKAIYNRLDTISQAVVRLESAA